MDDIAGLGWSSTPTNGQKTAASNYSAFSTLKPTPPVSGQASPLNSTSPHPPTKPITPSDDSFANLVSFGGNSNKNLSLLEQQKRQTEAKLHQQRAQSQTLKDQYAGGDDQFWNTLGSGRGTPSTDSSRNATTSKNGVVNDGGDDDLFAAFNRPPEATSKLATAASERTVINNDDDLFGLSNSASQRAPTTVTAISTDDDVLGLLGRPAPALTRKEHPPPAAKAKAESADLHPQDRAVAELVDMGFTADKAKIALQHTKSGTDIQAAVGYLLNEAHSDSRQHSQSRGAIWEGGQSNVDRTRSGPRLPTSRPSTLSETENGTRNRDQGFARTTETDIEHKAAEFGNNFLKTAGALWKQGTKKVQQAVQELNSDSDSGSQPRWMREAERPIRSDARVRRREDELVKSRIQTPSSDVQGSVGVTDEAMMLESSRPNPPPRLVASSRADRRVDSSADSSRDHSPSMHSSLRESLSQKQPAFMRQQNSAPIASSRSTLNKTTAEEQAAQAYVSSARRRKPPPESQVPTASSEPDLLDGAPKTVGNTREPVKVASNLPARPHSQLARRVEAPVRQPTPTRRIPPVSEISLKASHSHREKGNEHFKRGDYSSAHQSYATSISHLPENHPLVIVLLTNRALTALKIGEPKAAIADADRAIAVIGPSKGESETIDLGTGDAPKPMREYYGKALMRKAEALEQMEKWAEAALAWHEAVAGGHGGAYSIQGRIRSEKATNPKPSKTAPSLAARKPAASTPVISRRPATIASSSSSLSSASAATATAPAAAVARLRAANVAAEKADDEKFRLADSVDARIQAWKGGKADNLRALLASLENVLWAGSGWKKISMADLVLPGKVKVHYMKGIAKVHPDKIPTDATTEQRMIAGAVFSTLNEAWDKFKAENGL
ncbi:hypothetical protein A1O3_00388 [Capronia epimyces CBS 606.96]|uniref:UBA domain-containing protein n=1 Tax=Capronia epimyces CBS 606.96 TaxID=1182542 RepID=W9YH45_9EURO|nr:uncharacterized protein A1O3_00388 [Capronia epimyces CBS 606.96]EXJ91838.1 hypothetical protein A1O3_00388 [Capronia epimyces CBS 606.96]